MKKDEKMTEGLTNIRSNAILQMRQPRATAHIGDETNSCKRKISSIEINNESKGSATAV